MQTSGDLLADRRFSYAEALMKEGDPAGAADLARQTLDLVPRWVPAWMLLGSAEEANGNTEAAIDAFQQAETLDVSGLFGAGLHLARLRGGPPPAAMPESYVTALFDDYAPRFDRHLVDDLGYRGPAILAEALTHCCGTRRFARVLDLGCGTGLMAAALRERTAAIDGVDLSPGMIAVAQRKGLYRHLHVADIGVHLRAAPANGYDLIVAADVFVYLGELRQSLTQAARVLEPDGILAFTVQRSADEPMRLGDDLRFSHSEAHLRERLDEAGLAVALLREASTRRDRGADVPGLVVVARKP